jgi:hypothetical protein
MESSYLKFASVNVNSHTEKKNGLTYLSWAWAVDQLLRVDPAAFWTYDEPKMFGETMMVFCTVHALGKSMTAQLPVMDHRNRPIPSPDAFQVNTAMQRCLAKAIALHGLGLYIYAGEDLPYEEEKPKIEAKATVEQIQACKERLMKASSVEELRGIYSELADSEKAIFKEFCQALAERLRVKEAA